MAPAAPSCEKHYSRYHLQLILRLLKYENDAPKIASERIAQSTDTIAGELWNFLEARMLYDKCIQNQL